ncbi:flagellar motor switch protein FliM [Salinihabitans flavidus]|uniref:Flagellar motor switch protein FliM n=1 Tax=Salinihabitans flavidus TaxID=569882 RepID=A0A1H8MFB1_9RHOB|nr:hypothetical protein [Salinihabitans flavidus]SEO15876.1 flagellar motor switch protein FliM [Salinihabitans flavidus]
MGQPHSNSVLRRKASEGRQDHLARAMTPRKALRLALARAADSLMGLAITARDVAQERMRQEDLIGLLDDAALLMLLDGPDGHGGMVQIDRPFMAALVEHQTIGRVLPMPGADRRPTRVDAALAAPLIDNMLERLGKTLSDEREALWITGYRFGAMMEERRLIGLALAEPEFHVFSLHLEIGGGVKQGTMRIAFPHRKPQPPVQDDTATPDAPGLQSAVLHAPATLEAVLTRVTLPLSALQALKPGETLPIAADAPRNCALESLGTPLETPAVLGQMNGMRALRLQGGGGAAASLPPEAASAEPSIPELPELSDLPSQQTGETSSVTAPVPGAEGLEDLDDLPDLSDFDGFSDLPDLSGARAAGNEEEAGLDDLSLPAPLDDLEV